MLVLSVACSKSGGSPGSQGRCSDPNPDPASLTFAAVVCVLGEKTVPQNDGSRELKLRLSVTNKDPNTFTAALWQLELKDTAGNATDIDFDGIAAGSRSGSGDCIKQANDPFSAGWPLKPGEAFTLPGSACFNLQAGNQPTQLVFDRDIPVALDS
jgi:hypothetical protein